MMKLMWVPGPLEITVILIVALLIFGRRLPEVGRSLGKSIVEFKKGIKGIEDEIDSASQPRSGEEKKEEKKEGS